MRADGQPEGQTYIRKLIVAFRNFVNALKNCRNENCIFVKVLSSYTIFGPHVDSHSFCVGRRDIVGSEFDFMRS